jgi:hypothetical protein
MSVDRKRPDRFGRELNADRLLLEYVKFVLANEKWLRASKTTKSGEASVEKKLAIVGDVYVRLELGERRIDGWKRNVVDECVELVHKGYGNEYVPVHADKRRKGLRYGA